MAKVLQISFLQLVLVVRICSKSVYHSKNEMVITNDKHMRSWFWRRFGATWIDSLVVYAIGCFLVAGTGIIRLRISIEPLYVLLFAVYGTVLLARKGQTIGKSLVGIRITDKSGERPSIRIALIREALGKWGATVMVPVLLARGQSIPVRTFIPITVESAGFL